MSCTIIRKPELETCVGLTERRIRDLERDGVFPRRFLINPSGRAVGWLRSEVDAYLQARADSRETKTGTS